MVSFHASSSSSLLRMRKESSWRYSHLVICVILLGTLRESTDAFITSQKGATRARQLPRGVATDLRHSSSLSHPTKKTSDDDQPRRGRKRAWLKHTLRLGQRQSTTRRSVEIPSSTDITSTTSPNSIRVTNRTILQNYFDNPPSQFRKSNDSINYNALVGALDVRGDTQIIGTPNYTHPVAQLIHERKRQHYQRRQPSSSNTTATSRPKVALAIEGGGMRGCVSAGVVAAVHYLNLTQTIDAVYGSSAGSLIGSYLITDQLPWFGAEVYYDTLTTAGRKFIDSRRLLRALGWGLLDPRLIIDVFRRPKMGKPVLNLAFLLQNTLQQTKRLDWDAFVEKQNEIPLKVIVSDLKSERARVMDMEKGYFDSLSELAETVHASCLLPGIAGPLMNVDMDVVEGKKEGKKYILGNNIQDDRIHPIADALVYEALPYPSAIEEGATHVIMIRSRPDGADVTGKPSFFESLIYRRFFLRKNRLRNIYERFQKHWHKKIYADSVLELNDHAFSHRDYMDLSRPHLMTIAAPPGSPEIPRLETGREAIFEGMRRGFARAYDCLVEDPSERGRGVQVAKEVFPDEILLYDPLEIKTTEGSAYEYYLERDGRAHTPHSRF